MIFINKNYLSKLIFILLFTKHNVDKVYKNNDKIHNLTYNVILIL